MFRVSHLLKNNFSPQSLLSTLWTFSLFNMILKDLHDFPTEGYVEKLMALHLPEAEMLIYAFVVEIPIMMVFLSRILNPTSNKWANVIAAGITMLGMLSMLPEGQLDDFFFAIVNAGAYLLIILTAWRLPDVHQTSSAHLSPGI